MTKPSQEICVPLALEIGEPPELALMLDPDFAQEMQGVADRVQWENARGGNEFDTGKAAERAIATIGCDACKLSGVCVVRTKLEDKVESGRTETGLERTATMLAAAPQWLAAARINRSGADPNALRETINDREQTKKALADGTLDATELLAGVANETEGFATKQDLPELSGFAGVDPDQKIELQRLVADNGDIFLVADASSTVNFRGEPLPPTEYGILTGKLLERMTHRGQDGKPQVQSPDNTMQKVLRTTPTGHLDEVRMSGKNRLYVTVTPDQEQNLTRIVILGSHGGDAATQQAFLNKLGI
jgi:hypothetical protein